MSIVPESPAGSACWAGILLGPGLTQAWACWTCHLHWGQMRQVTLVKPPNHPAAHWVEHIVEGRRSGEKRDQSMAATPDNPKEEAPSGPKASHPPSAPHPATWDPTRTPPLAHPGSTGHGGVEKHRWETLLVSIYFPFFFSSTCWMLGSTPPEAMVTPLRSLFSSSSLRMANCGARGWQERKS